MKKMMVFLLIAVISASLVTAADIKEVVKCMFEDSMKSQSCSSSFGMCKGKDTCQVLYHGQSSDASVVWTSSCGGSAETINDGVADVITFTCASGAKEKLSEKPVQSNFGQSVASAAKSMGMMKSGMAVGKSFAALKKEYDIFSCSYGKTTPVPGRGTGSRSSADCKIIKNSCKGKSSCKLTCPIDLEKPIECSIYRSAWGCSKVKCPTGKQCIINCKAPPAGGGH